MSRPPAGRRPATGRRRATRLRDPAGGRGAQEHGAVTAELAMAVPVLLALTVLLAWLLSIGLAQVRAVDAARETARAVARGDDTARAVSVGRRIAPDGALVRVAGGADRVLVTVTARVAGPAVLVRGWPATTVRAEAVALAEEEG